MKDQSAAKVVDSGESVLCGPEHRVVHLARCVPIKGIAASD
jgi:hypothetical protein